MIKCIIIDDESFAIKLIEAYVQKIPYLELVAACKGSLEALNILQEQQIDLLFLDIQMPDLTGFELLKTLAHKPQVIIISAYPEFALDGFKWDVTDYLLKPVPFERFVEAVNKAKKRIIPNDKESGKVKDHFFVRGEHKMIKVRINEILYIESFREYAHLYTTSGKHIIRKSLSSFQELLDEAKFMRVHRSFIISLEKIDAVYGNIIQIGEVEIPIGKNYKEGFIKKVELI